MTRSVVLRNLRIVMAHYGPQTTQAMAMARQVYELRTNNEAVGRLFYELVRGTPLLLPKD